MSTTKGTQAIDEVSSKTPGALRIVYTNKAGYDQERALGDLDPKDWITKQMFVDNVPGIPTPITEAIPNGGTGSFAYAYDGRFGGNPTTYVQQIVSGEFFSTQVTTKISADGATITALGDFSTDSYQLIIKP